MMLNCVVRVAARTLVIGAVALAGLGLPAHAQDKAATGEDPVVARVNGQEIKRSEVLVTIGKLPPQLQQMPLPMLFPAVVDQIVNGKLLSAAALKDNLAGDPEVKERMKRAEERIVQEIYLARTIRTRITEAKLKERYQEFLKENPAQEEVKASHILLDSEDAAKAVIAQLKGGADFAALAKEKSSDKAAAAQGGDLGYFSRKDMVEEFSEAAFKLQSGQITETPVKTEFGWHVIKVEDRRTGEPTAFDEVKEHLETELSQETVGEVLNELRATAKIERFQVDGSAEAPAAKK